MQKTKPMKVALLGDSIFDNQAYVEPGQAVLDKINLAKPLDTEFELLALDGATTEDIAEQCALVDEETDLIFLSCGGNNALNVASVFEQQARTVFDGMHVLSEIQNVFKRQYEEMLVHILVLEKKLVVCSIYNTCPGLPCTLLAALSFFNDVIFEKAFKLGLPVLDLRLMFNSPADYSAISPIEPSESGGEKLAEKIVSLVSMHDFSASQSFVYC